MISRPTVNRTLKHMPWRSYLNGVSSATGVVGVRLALTCAKKAMYQYGQRGFMIAMSMGDNADNPQAISTIHMTGIRLTK